MFGFCLSCMGSSYISFYANCIPIMISWTFSFSSLTLLTDSKWFDPGGTTLVYTPWNIQASNFCSVFDWKCFGTSHLEFEMDELY